MRGEQAIFNLEIKKKSGLSINPDIHHSKVFRTPFIVPLKLSSCMVYPIYALRQKRIKFFEENIKFVKAQGNLTGARKA